MRPNEVFFLSACSIFTHIFVRAHTGEEVQDDMTFWLDSRTLGIAIQCYGTTKMVRGGENNLGFRIMQKGITLKLTHVIWR